MAPFAPSTSSSATQGDAFEQLQGKRILQLNNYFIFDYADKLKLAHQAVDSQFCECGTSPLRARPCRRPARAQKHVAPLERERWLERLAAQVRSKPWRYCGRYAERLRRERTHTHQAAAGCHAPVPWCARKRARCPFMLRAAACCCCCSSQSGSRSEWGCAKGAGPRSARQQLIRTHSYGYRAAGKLIICASAPMDCYKERLADVKYDAGAVLRTQG